VTGVWRRRIRTQQRFNDQSVIISIIKETKLDNTAEVTKIHLVLGVAILTANVCWVPTLSSPDLNKNGSKLKRVWKPFGNAPESTCLLSKTGSNLKVFSRGHLQKIIALVFDYYLLTMFFVSLFIILFVRVHLHVEKKFSTEYC